MDTRRFDQISKVFAGGVSRRTALRRLAGGGAAAALVSVGSRSRAFAQESTPAAGEAELCYADFEATVRQGPSTGLEQNGILVLRVEADGKIDEGSLIAAEGPAVTVVGQMDGRAVNLLFEVGEGQFLYGVGVLQNDIEGGCQAALNGAMGGPFVGPELGDSGDWALCCCPRPANDFTCPEHLPPCRACAEPPEPPVGGGGSSDPFIQCVNDCTLAGGQFNQCNIQCFQG